MFGPGYNAQQNLERVNRQIDDLVNMKNQLQSMTQSSPVNNINYSVNFLINLKKLHTLYQLLKQKILF